MENLLSRVLPNVLGGPRMQHLAEYGFFNSENPRLPDERQCLIISDKNAVEPQEF